MASKTSAGSAVAKLHPTASGGCSKAFFAFRAWSIDRAFHARASLLPLLRGNARDADRRRPLTTPCWRLDLHPHSQALELSRQRRTLQRVTVQPYLSHCSTAR